MPFVTVNHNSANRHSCSTPAEMHDRKHFSIGRQGDMTNQFCRMLSFCWKLLSAYFAEIMITKYITKYSSNCAKCAYIKNTNVCFFQCMHAGQVGQRSNRPNFEL